jgi:hypothetical protein
MPDIRDLNPYTEVYYEIKIGSPEDPGFLYFTYWNVQQVNVTEEQILSAIAALFSGVSAAITVTKHVATHTDVTP